MVEKEITQNLQDIANILRIDALNVTDTAGSGHPTSGASLAELLSVLFFNENGMHFDPQNPRNFNNDTLVLSKGHACPIYYPAWARAGAFPVEDLKNMRKITSDLEGHPTPRLNFVDFATGSLGMGLANAAGVAYSSKYFDNAPTHKVYCILGDGECAEGAVWEAAHFSGLYKLDNLIAILDCNRLGQSDVTSLGHGLEIYESRFKAFGFHTIVIDGHNIDEIIKAYAEARAHKGSPVIIIGKTFKGKGFINVENKNGFHGKPMKSTEIIENIKKSIINHNPTFTVTKPKETFNAKSKAYSKNYEIELKYDDSKNYSTREVVGLAVKQIGVEKDDNTIIGLDGDVKNSTFLEFLYKEKPSSFINCFIAEQAMVGVAQGISKREKIPIIGTFSAFYTRAADHIRMGAVSFTNVKYFGTHCGCHIGEDGPSQMGLEEISLFRSVPNMVVLCPSDVVSAWKATELAFNTQSSVFIRTGRNATKRIYDNSTKFEVGKCQVLKSSTSSQVCLIGHGQTTHELLQAHEELKKENIETIVIDLFTIKPIDKEEIIKQIRNSNNTALVVEDHYYEGGAGEAVKSAVSEEGFRIFHQAVSNIPRSGKPAELYDLFGLSAKKVVELVKEKVLKK